MGKVKPKASKCPTCKIKWDTVQKTYICNKCGNLPEKFFIQIYIKRYGKVRIYSHIGIPFVNQKHAENVLIRMRSEVDDNSFDLRNYQAKDLKQLRFKVFAEKWITHYYKREENDEIARSYFNRINSYVHDRFTPYFGSRDIRHINTGDIIQFKDQLKCLNSTKPLSLKSQKNILGVLQKIFRDAKIWGEIDTVPNFPSIKVPDAPWNWIDVEPQEKVYNAVQDQHKPIYLFLIHTGVRTQEAAAVQYQDLDLINEQVTIQRAFSDGKLRCTKTGKIRVLPLNPALLSLLKSLPTPINKDQFLFLNHRNKTYNNSELLRIWKNACTEVGVEGVHLQAGSRHSLASQAAVRGTSIHKVSAVLGHTDIKTTQRYAHLDTTSLREVVIKSPIRSSDITPIKSKK